MVINKRVVYIQMLVGDKLYDDNSQMEAIMYVILRDYEITEDKNKLANLKIVCIYSNEGTSGEIKRAANYHETSVAAVS